MLQNVCSIDEHSEMFFPVQDIAPADEPMCKEWNLFDEFLGQSSFLCKS